MLPARRLEGALKGAMVDLSKRMVDIKEALDDSATPTNTRSSSSGIGRERVEEKERMLDELLDLVESIDQAKDLSTIGGLSTLLTVLESGEPSLQWRAAEIVGTCAQNNPPVQLSFLEGGVMPSIWSLLQSNDETCRLKSLLAISCMIRECAPAHAWYSEHGGVEKILTLLEEEKSVRIQRKCLQILDYAVKNSSEDFETVVKNGSRLVAVLSKLIAESENSDVRSAALCVAKSMGMTSIDGLQALQVRQ